MFLPPCGEGIGAAAGAGCLPFFEEGAGIQFSLVVNDASGGLLAELRCGTNTTGQLWVSALAFGRCRAWHFRFLAGEEQAAHGKEEGN